MSQLRPQFGPLHTTSGTTLHPAPATRHLSLTTQHSALNIASRPLLKWAGGKRQLLPALRSFYPAAFGRYFEPFVGSGAVFFDLHASGRLDGMPVRLTDCNADLIGCYRMVRDRTGEVRKALARLARGHEAGGSAHFYEVRERFNRARARLVGTAVADAYTPAMAGMLIYLNRTGFNGLFRLNAAGQFNVPAGRYVRPTICDPAHLAGVAAALGAPGVSLELAPFESVLRHARTGNLIYFDPPYAPVSPTARFTSYTAKPFTLDDHARLRDCAVTLATRGCAVMVSNSSAPAVAALYADDPRVAAAGLRVFRIPARRAINSRGSARGPVTEFLLTNQTPRQE
jgi:DNA adenine methylase